MNPSIFEIQDIPYLLMAILSSINDPAKAYSPFLGKKYLLLDKIQ